MSVASPDLRRTRFLSPNIRTPRVRVCISTMCTEYAARSNIGKEPAMIRGLQTEMIPTNQETTVSKFSSNSAHHEVSATRAPGQELIHRAECI